jgi:hypothetical protein
MQVRPWTGAVAAPGQAFVVAHEADLILPAE